LSQPGVAIQVDRYKQLTLGYEQFALENRTLYFLAGRTPDGAPVQVQWFTGSPGLTERFLHTAFKPTDAVTGIGGNRCVRIAITRHKQDKGGQ
jgi:hypothetical protein